ncbi:YdcF family protein [Fervidobacterium gondwanense]|uniref:PEP-CTERM protein-sorting domain-containing protein n=1 Tax=Fervidobacterium gondwanense DSM 13020 TaxID=1121883 RepID=A0A1M7SUQ9_FERGO|nr:YdcF family protein [Fervidobacterium gondwanense]SHN62219.1 PEP-CTERM protein-sorting domain-containing protein [Fervidobacterium gondwanense DSM 13020]
MFALLKIISSFVVFPGIIVLLFLVLSFILYKKRNKAWRIFLALSFVFYIASSNWFAYLVSKTLYIPDTDDNGRYIVVLGGGIDIYNSEREIGKHTLRRLYRAYQLYLKNPRRIIVTGGVVTKGIPEASVMRDVLVSFGVPEENIIVEERARNTYENAKYTYELVGSVPITLVTSTTHMRRSLLSFGKFFSKIYHVQADYPIDFRNVYLDYVPNHGGFYTFSQVFYEWIGILQYALFKK